MDPAFVFGYGSLLEGGTGTPCRLAGHRRRFGVAMDNRRTLPGYKYFLDAATGERPPVFVAFLDLLPDPGAGVDGVAIPVDGARLAALDDRERNYRRVDVTAQLEADLGGPVWAYMGLVDARERYARGVAAGAAVVARGYVDGVRAGFAAHGLDFDAGMDALELPVVDLELVRVAEQDGATGGVGPRR
jgi:cation transport regulator ChaC